MNAKQFQIRTIMSNIDKLKAEIDALKRGFDHRSAFNGYSVIRDHAETDRRIELKKQAIVSMSLKIAQLNRGNK